MTTFDDLFPALPRIDREWEARKQRLMALTAAQRVAAMRAGELSYRELCHWSAARPTKSRAVAPAAASRRRVRVDRRVHPRDRRSVRPGAGGRAADRGGPPARRAHPRQGRGL